MKTMIITSRALRTLSVVAIVGLIAGCKIAVIVVEGGAVQTDFWLSELDCSEGSICIEQVNDTNYTKTFTAIPKPGWRFVKWNSGDYALCSNSTSPYCELSGASFAGNAVAEAIVASPQTYYLMPLFAPLTEIEATVMTDGKAWASMNGFGDLSWDDINAVCPVTNGGHCLVGGKLMEYDMTGWTWASVDDVNALINSYPLSPPWAGFPSIPAAEVMGPGPDSVPFSGVGFFWNTEGFPTSTFLQGCGGCFYYTWKGWTSTQAGVPGQAHLAEVAFNMVITDISGHATTLLTDDRSAGHSAWFYRTP